MKVEKLTIVKKNSYFKTDSKPKNRIKSLLSKRRREIHRFKIKCFYTKIFVQKIPNCCENKPSINQYHHRKPKKGSINPSTYNRFCIQSIFLAIKCSSSRTNELTNPIVSSGIERNRILAPFTSSRKKASKKENKRKRRGKLMRQHRWRETTNGEMVVKACGKKGREHGSA